MSSFSPWRRTAFAAIVGLAAGLPVMPAARSQVAPGSIADHDSIFVDGRSFRIIPGRAKLDAADRIRALGGRDLSPGAIIYRSGHKLYLLAPPLILERGGPGSLVIGADKVPADRIHIQYDPPKNPEHEMVYKRLTENKALETMQRILSPLRLPVALTIKTLGCDGVINSWYNTDNSVPTIHMCYELLQNIIKTTGAEDIRPGVSQHDAIVGQFLFWTLHETGHAVFDIFQAPLLGREEDAADQFAGYLMLHFGKDQARRWVEGAAYSAEEFMKDFGPTDNYASVHGLPQQRFYNLLCLAYGADPVLFADVTQEMMAKMTARGFLPRRRADNCEYEFQAFDHAFKSLIGPHVDPQMAKAVMDMTWFPPPRDKAPPK